MLDIEGTALFDTFPHGVAQAIGLADVDRLCDDKVMNGPRWRKRAISHDGALGNAEQDPRARRFPALGRSAALQALQAAPSQRLGPSAGTSGAPLVSGLSLAIAS